MTHDRIKKGKDRSPFFLLLPPPPRWTSSRFISNHSKSKYITSKFLSTQNYLYRLHCKMDKESSLRGGFRQQHHSTSWTSYRIMGVSYRQTSFGHCYHGFWQSLHHCVLDMSVFGGGGGRRCVWECFSEELDCNEDKALLLSASSSERHFSSNYMNCICKKGNRRC